MAIPGKLRGHRTQGTVYPAGNIHEYTRIDIGTQHWHNPGVNQEVTMKYSGLDSQGNYWEAVEECTPIYGYPIGGKSVPITMHSEWTIRSNVAVKSFPCIVSFLTGQQSHRGIPHR